MNKCFYIPEADFQIIRISGDWEVYVDTVDYPLVIKHNWFYMTGGYAATGHDSIRMHHLILGVTDFSEVEVHHINDNGMANRRCNLKVMRFGDHLMTRPKQSNNQSGYKGVSWKNKQGNRKGAWIAQISFGGKRRHIGRFKDPHEAARAYNKTAIRFYGSDATLNEIKNNGH